MTKEEYVNARYDEYLHYWADIGLRIGPVVVLSLIPLDYFASPSNFISFLIIRFCTASVLGLFYLLNKSVKSRGVINIIVILAAFAVSMMISFMVSKLGGHESPYATGFILIGIFVCGIIPLSATACTISSAIVYSLYIFPILSYDKITNIPFFISESILILACILTILILRTLANRRLFIEFGLQFELGQHRENLEKQIKDRTYQLSNTIISLEQEVQDRQEAEKRLIESQDILRRLADDSPMALSMVTKDGTIEYTNRKHEEIMGYSQKDIPTLEKWWRLAYPDDAVREKVKNEWWNLVARLTEGETLPSMQRVIHCMDGTVKDVELRIALAADKIIVAFDDVTEKRRIANLIQQAKDDWEDTFNTLNDAITIHDRDFNIIRTNMAAEVLLGKEAKDILGNKCYSSYHGADCPPEGCPSCQTMKTGSSSISEIFEPHLGKYLEIKAIPRIDKEHNIIGIIHIVRDITEKKKTEAALAEQHNFASNLIENSSVATFVLNKNHRIMLWNKACEELTGCRSSDMIGTDDQWKPFYTYKRPTVADVIIDGKETDLPKLYGHYSRSALNPLAVKAEGWYHNLGGKERYIAFEASPIFNSRGELTASIETLQDLTKSRKLEEQLLQAQKIEAIGQLAGGVAHDFNNILTAIVGYAHLTLIKMPADDPLRINLEQILQASDKATVLTQSLLAFSRKQIMNPKPVDLIEIVVRLEKLLKRLIREDIHISTIFMNKNLTICADAGQIEQVLMNLVTNARDALPKGGQIVITTEEISIDNAFIEQRGYGRPGKYAYLSVADNGEGMDEKIRERIFEPFFTTKEQGKGTGLGLAMVYGIITQHEGFIDVVSEPGKGSVFEIFLPLTSGITEKTESRGETAAVRGGNETILLTEDDRALRKLMSTILRNQGYKVIEAVDGEDAIEKYGSNKDNINLLVLDGIMPKKNGRETYDEIKLINPSVKALFVSGYAEDIISRHGLLDSDIHFVQKPLSPSDLLKKVRELLDSDR